MSKLLLIAKSKTMGFATILVILGIVQQTLPQFEGVIPPDVYGVIVSAIGVAVAVLRVLTNQPLSEKMSKSVQSD